MNCVGETPAAWHLPSQHPKRNGWYPVMDNEGAISVRCWEDGAWWLACHQEGYGPGDDGGWAFVPNNSFSYWADLQPLPVATEPALGVA